MDFLRGIGAGEVISENIFLRFFGDFKLLMFTDNILKNSENFKQGNLLKICFNLPILPISA